MTGLYAESTRVDVASSVLEAQRYYVRYGGDVNRFQHIVDNHRGRGIFQFPYHGRMINFGFQRPADQQQLRSAYRWAAKYIHMELDSVKRGFRRPEEAFYQYIVLDDGQTLFERTRTMLPTPRQPPEQRQ